MTIADPEAPGRGPGRMGGWYRFDRSDDLPVMGRFVGVVFGTHKGADTLMVRLAERGHVRIRYECLERAVPARECSQCGDWMLCGLDRVWVCRKCGLRG